MVEGKEGGGCGKEEVSYRIAEISGDYIGGQMGVDHSTIGNWLAKLKACDE